MIAPMTHPGPQFGIPLPGVTYRYRPGAYAVIQGENGLIAFVPGPPGRLGLPGGGVDDGETADAALLREIIEEIGWEARLLGPAGHATQYLPREGEGYVAVLATYFRAELTARRTGICEHEVLWHTLAEVAPMLAREADVWAVSEVLKLAD